jgi:putative ABC transport system permease protein
MAATSVVARAAWSRRRIGSTLLIGLVIALAAAALAASIVVRGEASDRVDAAFDRADGADLVLYVEPAAIDVLGSVLAADPHVVRVGHPLPSVPATLDDHDRTSLELRSLPATGSLNAPVITEGRPPAAEREALFDAALAGDHGIAVGDEVTIVTGDGIERSLDVVGLGFDFSDCLYPQCDPAHVWVSAATNPALMADARATMVPVDVAESGDVGLVVSAVRARLGDALLGSNDWPDTRGDLLVVTDFIGAFLGAFGLFVLVASGVVIASAVAARTMARRRTIALYKAVGFTGPQLARAVLLEHVLIAVSASGFGWLAATLLGPALRVGPLRLLETGDLDWNGTALLVTCAATTLIVVVATLVPAWRAGRVDVTSALAGDTRSGRRGRRRGGTRAADLPLPVAFAMAGIRARPVRAGFNVVAIVIAVVAAVVSLSIVRSIDVVMLDPALSGDPADVELEPADGYTSGDVGRMLGDTPGVSAWYSFVDDTATVAGRDVHVRAVGGDPSTTGFVVGAGRLPEHAGEAAAGYGLLQARGWHLGDRLTVDLSGTSFDLELVGWYRESEDSGRVLQMRMEDYARAVDDIGPTFGVHADASTSTDALAARLTGEFGTAASVRPNVPDRSGVRPFRVALGVMTLLIAAVALAHLTAAMLTTQRESRRRQGIQRAIGLEHSQLLSEGLVHGSALAALALVIAVPLGWYAQRAIGDLLTSAIGIGPGLMFGPTVADMAIIATITLLACGLATAAAIWPALRHAPDRLLTDD